jgi:hypothetical protein
MRIRELGAALALTCALSALSALIAPAAGAAATDAPAPAPAPVPVGSAASTAGAAGPASPVVVTVDGTPITLRMVEEAVLRKEGLEELQDGVEKAFAKIDWARTGFDQPLMRVCGRIMTKRDLAERLLSVGAPVMRSELIDMALVASALTTAGLVIDQVDSDRSWEAMKREFEASHKDGDRIIDFASFLDATQHQTEQEFRVSPAFLQYAGLRRLALEDARAHASESDLQAWFDGHRDAYDTQATAQLDEIYIGVPPGDAEEARNAYLGLVTCFADIRDGKSSFAQLWKVLGKSYDPDAAEGGAIGWIPRDGTRAKSTSPRIPKALMDKAFATPKDQLPRLLPPMSVDGGVFLLRVDALKDGRASTYAEAREQVIADLVDHTLGPRIDDILARLHRRAVIEILPLRSLKPELGPRAPGDEAAVADPATAAIATIDGHPLTLRQLADHALRQRGSDLLQEWAESTYAALDWGEVGDHQVVLAIGDKGITRRDLAVALLRKNASQARHDLIDATLVREAVAKHAIVVDQAASDAAWRAMRADYVAAHKGDADGGDFVAYIRRTEHLTPAEFRREDGFAMFASLRLLAISMAQARETDQELAAWFEAHRSAWDEPEAVHLLEIRLPSAAQDAAGRDRAQALAATLAADIRGGRQSFAQAFATAHGATWDAAAGPGGDIGWIARDGARPMPNAPTLPPALVAAAFAAPADSLPVLLPPFLYDGGAYVVRVEAHRPGRTAAFAAVRQAVLVDLVEHELTSRMEEVLDTLHAGADIQYASLEDAVDARGP